MVAGKGGSVRSFLDGRKLRSGLITRLGTLSLRLTHDASMHDHAVKGKRLQVEYFGETYPVEVAGVGYEPLYDPENLKPRT